MSAAHRQQLRAVTQEAKRLHTRIDRIDALRFLSIHRGKSITGQTAGRLNDYRLKVEARYLKAHREQLRLRHLLTPPPPSPIYFRVPKGVIIPVPTAS